MLAIMVPVINQTCRARLASEGITSFANKFLLKGYSLRVYDFPSYGTKALSFKAQCALLKL